MSAQIVRVRVHRDVGRGAETAGIFEDTYPDSGRTRSFDSVVLDMMICSQWPRHGRRPLSKGLWS